MFSERACGPDKLHLTFSEEAGEEKTCILYADRGFCYLKHNSNGVQQVHLSSHKPWERVDVGDLVQPRFSFIQWL